MAKKYKNILLVGSTGLLGRAVAEALSDRRYHVMNPTTDEFDITDQEQMLEFFRHKWPDCIINCSSISDIDENENEKDTWPELVNLYGPSILANLCRDLGVPLVHFSTGDVFEGSKGAPYTEEDQPNPVNRFGLLNWEAEQAIIDEGTEHLIIRTSWLFGPGRTNLVSLIVRSAQVGDPIEASKDTYSCPTYTFDIADAVVELLEYKARGIYHVVNSGSVNMYDLAQAVLELANVKGDSSAVPADLAYKARRPLDSSMSTKKMEDEFGITMRGWKEALTEYIEKYLHSDILLSDDIIEADVT